MADMHVFRVEYTENHCGPFTTSVRSKTICRHVERWMDYVNDNLGEFPIAWIDGIPVRYDPSIVLGCSKLDILKKWFYLEDAAEALWKSLEAAGLSIAEYVVSSEYVIPGKSGKQLGFFREKAQLRRYHGIADTFRNTD